jgi:hypothetical protein
VRLLADFHPVAPAVPPGGSLAGWVWTIVVAAIVIVGGMVLASRR